MWSGSKLATSSSSSATVGERAARTTVGLTCSHRRHERHERRDATGVCHRAKQSLSYLFYYLSTQVAPHPPCSGFRTVYMDGAHE